MLNCFRRLFLLCALLATPMAVADKIALSPFCQALAGEWQGEASRPQGQIKPVQVEGICSADRRQLMLSVSQHASHPLSETWWFREGDGEIKLTYFNGVDADKILYFSLYREGAGFSLLGKGIVQQRPAMIRLNFTPQGSGWLWLQKVQYLDQDDDDYQVYRGIALNPIAQG
ncbi:hypothetical protein [Shewanella marisflavi]|uniref:DUF1579 domain-containing protein n=1 Tax=Shewanella marisflavi TaxID=260364 RepID=A0AAC9U1F9_9GAMM|nr:hypothetical protein [Shewanella marisflavi]ASJ98285.1 hypothetical protein CFF01_17755 [Shewanella marisflavi]